MSPGLLPCAQRRVALMSLAIAKARDALSNNRHESAAHFEGPAKQALVLATKPQAKQEPKSVLYHACLSFIYCVCMCMCMCVSVSVCVCMSECVHVCLQSPSDQSFCR